MKGPSLASGILPILPEANFDGDSKLREACPRSCRLYKNYFPAAIIPVAVSYTQEQICVPVAQVAGARHKSWLIRCYWDMRVSCARLVLLAGKLSKG